MRNDGSYSLGFAKIFNHNPRELLLDRAVSAKYFFEQYRGGGGGGGGGRGELHVIKITVGRMGEYYAVLKTRWIKLIQKKWRQVFEERQMMMLQRRSISALRARELTGRFPEGMRVVSNLLVGMIVPLCEAQHEAEGKKGRKQ